ncbi:hypothetical protein HZU38_05415 [Mycolicibacterium vanbaalenii]|uniref:hypothetical protein n=1 Tax=Mycolicibacterium vanbaalenii TaxID=110539 RepID=UPI001F2DA070|nr:hypothetical protein [Mycolicibacterium vanbaalenii]UJL29940.1 hypothetical protein HZU38_05415 [Mycolicibacterium vanbaalenii]WND56998.1 hypothetical protein QQA43_00850 [Mycolicibacterium vanbaalenii]
MPWNAEAVERIAPGIPTLVHPGDADTPPFPMHLSVFQTATLPEAMVEEMAEDMGMPSPDIALHFLEALLHLAEERGYELVSSVELAEKTAAATVNEGKRNAIKQCRTVCGEPAYRIMFRDFNTDEPIVPCETAPGHDCKARR